ncbi:MAG: gluconate 2-dehydrogenase subunit 3 family protein [Nitrososphaerales archaeon]
MLQFEQTNILGNCYLHGVKIVSSSNNNNSNTTTTTTKRTRRDFLKIGAAAAGGAAVASAVGLPFYMSENSSLKSKLSTAQGQLSQEQIKASGLQTQINTTTGFVSLNVSEQAELAAITETIIPSDGNGPGAKEAGVIYFIDRQLASDYGRSGNMFMDGPFVLSGQTGPITVGNVTYSAGSPKVRVGAGTRYQYALNMREYWRVGLVAVENYSNSAYGGQFEKITSAQQMQVLKDLWANKPTMASFSNILPEDFAYELTFMTWAGFLMDPLYGGNQNMVGWEFTGYNGVNLGNAYGEGKDQKDLMVQTTPFRLKPASLAQYQQQISGGT